MNSIYKPMPAWMERRSQWAPPQFVPASMPMWPFVQYDRLHQTCPDGGPVFELARMVNDETFIPTAKKRDVHTLVDTDPRPPPPRYAEDDPYPARREEDPHRRPSTHAREPESHRRSPPFRCHPRSRDEELSWRTSPRRHHPRSHSREENTYERLTRSLFPREGDAYHRHSPRERERRHVVRTSRTRERTMRLVDEDRWDTNRRQRSPPLSFAKQDRSNRRLMAPEDDNRLGGGAPPPRNLMWDHHPRRVDVAPVRRDLRDRRRSLSRAVGDDEHRERKRLRDNNEPPQYCHPPPVLRLTNGRDHRYQPGLGIPFPNGCDACAFSQMNATMRKKGNRHLKHFGTGAQS